MRARSFYIFNSRSTFFHRIECRRSQFAVRSLTFDAIACDIRIISINFIENVQRSKLVVVTFERILLYRNKNIRSCYVRILRIQVYFAIFFSLRYQIAFCSLKFNLILVESVLFFLQLT